jgi:hypothetical protein
MKLVRPLLTAVVLFFTTTSFGQQSFMEESGIPAFTTAFSVEHGFINLANGGSDARCHLVSGIGTY